MSKKSKIFRNLKISLKFLNNKKAIQFTTTQLLLLIIAIAVILFMIVWYTELGNYMTDIVKNMFG